ncbi:MAG: VWA domain-containing protein [Candidatus Korobacteraceae bacterium]
MKATRGTIAATFFAIALGGIAVSAQQAATPAPAPSSTNSSSTTAQSSPSASPSLQKPLDANAPEISSQEEASTTFKVKVNLVEVRVVVRDAYGKAVGNLKQEDFQLTDNGKAQIISKFSVEQAAATRSPKPAGSGTPIEDAGPKMPERYIAYLFDDIHLKFGDLAQVRESAWHNLQTLQPTDRAAILTTSGQTQLDFTDDRDKLHDTLNRLLPRPITGSGVQECPDISYYMADQIINKNDQIAAEVVMQEAASCGVPVKINELRNLAQRALNLGDHETQVSLSTIRDVIRRIAAMPGQRSIILVSPGFYNPDQLQEQMDIADRALHSGVTVNTLDARGLYTTMPDASTQAPSHDTAGPMLNYMRDEASADADVLSDLAYATGGTFIQNTNDLVGGLRRLATPPEYSYLLGFSPQNLKFDGHFHNLKVTVKGQKLNIQARKGYYAPKQAASAAEQAKQQIRDEVFSQEELHDLPVELHTQFFKTSDDDAKLSVLVKLDVQHLHYRKVDGRNNNSLTVVSAVFDRNGNFVTGNQKTLHMHWKDETLGTKLASGVTLKSSFDVKPGSYLVRLVVRDDEGQLAAQNGAIEIP